MKRTVEKGFKEIFSVSCFSEFLVQAGYSSAPLSNAQISIILREAAAKSYLKKYFVLPRPKGDTDFVLLS